MAAASKVHDAVSGFHDIKALGRLSQDLGSSFSVISALIGAIVALTLFLIFLFLKNRRKSKRLVSPFEQFQLEVERLQAAHKSSQALPRETATQLSEGVRKLLGSVFAFPAPELTAKEIQERLPSAFSKRFPWMRNNPLEGPINNSLRSLEYISFAPEEHLTSGKSRLDEAFSTLLTLNSKLRAFAESQAPMEDHVAS